MPSELSGGQRRRVAIARALTSRPQILLYDEPTTGLDPITALTIDDEIIKLRDLEGVSSIIVTHQLRDAFFIATHEAVDGTGDDVAVRAGVAEEQRRHRVPDAARTAASRSRARADELRASTISICKRFCRE